MKTKKAKIKIESIRVEAQYDESPDTSNLGEYTNKASDWAIDRASGEFCYKIWQRARIIESLENKIYDLGDIITAEQEHKLARYEYWKTKIERSGATETGNMHNEYSFFLPSSNHIPHNPRNWDHVQGKERAQVVREFGSVKNADLAYAKQDYKRMEALNNGNWQYIGIIAKAKILVPSNVPQSAQYQTISSGGLWGIESDCGKEFLDEVIQEQLSDLAGQLEALGIGKRSIHYAIKNCDKELIWK